jgi:hypothetical protein
MAYVRKTDILVDGIRQKVRQIGKSAARQYDSSELEIDSPEFNGLYNGVVNKCWEEAPDLKDKLPKSWLKEVERMFVKIVQPDGNYWETLLRTGTNKPFYLPPTKEASDRYTPTFEINESHLDELTREYVQGANQRAEMLNQTKAKFKEIEDQLVSFMRSYASLNAALADMPELEMYVPDEFMEKYRAPNPKKAKRGTSDDEESMVETLNIDRDAIAAAAIAARMSQAAE